MFYKDHHFDSAYAPACKDDSFTKKEHCKGNFHRDKHGRFCVEDILRGILNAQKKAEKEMKHKCSSCKNAIEDLLEERKKYKHNTIPFILYCGCKPFKGVGVATYHAGHKDKKFICVESFIFRINDLKGDCAQLELLVFKPSKCHDKKFCSPCGQINHRYVKDLVRTGICINVDLSCFCGVTYLPAVRL